MLLKLILMSLQQLANQHYLGATGKAMSSEQNYSFGNFLLVIVSGNAIMAQKR